MWAQQVREAARRHLERCRSCRDPSDGGMVQETYLVTEIHQIQNEFGEQPTAVELLGFARIEKLRNWCGGRRLLFRRERMRKSSKLVFPIILGTSSSWDRMLQSSTIAPKTQPRQRRVTWSLAKMQLLDSATTIG